MSEAGGAPSSDGFSDGGSSYHAMDAREDVDASITDLLEQNRSLQEGVFFSMYLLTEDARKKEGWVWSGCKLFLEFYLLFLVLFEWSYPVYDIHQQNWFWRYTSWVQFKLPTIQAGYKTYVGTLYAIAGLAWTLVVLAAYVVVALRKSGDQGTGGIRRLLWYGRHTAYWTRLFFVAILQFLLVPFGNSWNTFPELHNKVFDTDMLTMPYLAHMVLAGITALLCAAITICLIVADCDLNPLARQPLATCAARLRLRVTVLQIALVVVASTLYCFPVLQASLLSIIVVVMTALELYERPYYNQWVNIIRGGGWLGLTFVVFNLLAAARGTLTSAHTTENVLYGIWPMMLGGMALAWGRARLGDRPLARFHAAPITATPREVYRFRRPQEVEVLARVMRKWDLDGRPDADSAALGERIIFCGLNIFPTRPAVHILNASFLMQVRGDVQGCRTHLQLAGKHNPDLLERYFLFAAHEMAKRFKERDMGMDMMAYVEFQRNYRACVCAHKLALVSQQRFWQTMTRELITFENVQRCLEAMEKRQRQATRVYKRVMERYPSNGKLMKVYGQYQELVLHDPRGAAKCYREATRLGTESSLLSICRDAKSQDQITRGTLATTGGADKRHEFFNTINEKVDALTIIDASSIIISMNKAMYKLFGYGKGELDAKNINVLQPPVIAVHHHKYVDKWVKTNESKLKHSHLGILGLHKEGYTFPITISAARVSGLGSESLFMGVVRKAEVNKAELRLWASPTGALLCVEEHSIDWLGASHRELTGRTLQSIVSSIDNLQSVLGTASELGPKAVHGSQVTFSFLHRYIDPVEVQATVESSGNADVPMLTFTCRRVVESLSVMAVDLRGRILYATPDLGALLGISLTQLLKMDLGSLIPMPFGAMHKQLIKSPPLVVPRCSCRAGQVVLMQASGGRTVPVRLNITTHSSNAGQAMRYIVKVEAVPPSQLDDGRRLVLTVDADCRVVAVDSATPEGLFGIPPASLPGSSVAQHIDVFRQQQDLGGQAALQELLVALVQRSLARPGSSWRVGVIPPQRSGGKRQLLGLRTSNRTCGAVMTVELAPEDSEVDVVQLVLWRADMLSAVLHVDGALHVAKADGAAPLLFGRALHSGRRLRLGTLLQLADRKAGGVADLLGAAGRTASALKGAGLPLVGRPVNATASHADGRPLHLTLQCVCTDQRLRHAVVHLRLLHPATGDGKGLVRWLKEHAAAASDSSDDDQRQIPNMPALSGQEDNTDIRGIGRCPYPTTHQRRLAGPAAHRREGHRHQFEGGHGHDGVCPDDVELSIGSAAGSYGGADDSEEEHDGKAQSMSSTQRVGRWLATSSDNIAIGFDNAFANGGTGNTGALLSPTPPPDGSLYPRLPPVLADAPSPRAAALLAPTAAVAPPTAADEFDAQLDSGDGENGLLHPTQWVLGTAVDEGDGGKMGAGAGAGSIVPQVHGAVSADQQQAGDVRQGSGWAAGARAEVTAKPPLSPGHKARELHRAKALDKGPAKQGPHPPAQGCAGGEGMTGSYLGETGAASGGSSEASTWQEGVRRYSGSMAEVDVVDAVEEAGSDVEEEMAVDMRRWRRLRRLTKIVGSPTAHSPIRAFVLRSWLVAASLLLLHIISFVVFTSQLDMQAKFITLMEGMAHGADGVQSGTLAALLVYKCLLPGNTTWPQCVEEGPDKRLALLMHAIDHMNEHHRGNFLGYNYANQMRDTGLYPWWVNNLYPEVLPPNMSPPGQHTTNASSLWEMGMRHLASLQDMYHNGPFADDNYTLAGAGNVSGAVGGALDPSREYVYVLDNGPASVYRGYGVSMDLQAAFTWQQLQGLAMLLLVLLAVETLGLKQACLFYQWALFRRLRFSHMQRFSVFLALPSATLRSMANMDIQVDGDVKTEFDDMGAATELEEALAAKEAAAAEAEGASINVRRRKSVRISQNNPLAQNLAKGSMSNAGPAKGWWNGVRAWLHAARRSFLGATHVRVNMRKMTAGMMSTLLFMAPLLLWEACVVAMYTSSLAMLLQMKEPLSSFNIALHLIPRSTHLRMLAARLVYESDPKAQLQLQAEMRGKLHIFSQEYNALLYGGKGIPEVASGFDQATQPVLFFDAATTNYIFYNTECLRVDQSTCLDFSSKYYEVTRTGLHVLVMRFIEEVTLLSNDDLRDVHPNSSRYDYIWRVASYDMFDGFFTASSMFSTYCLKRYSLMHTMHLVLLAASFFVFGLFVLGFLRPRVQEIHSDSRVVVGLLSLLPNEADIKSLLASAILGGPLAIGVRDRPRNPVPH